MKTLRLFAKRENIRNLIMRSLRDRRMLIFHARRSDGSVGNKHVLVFMICCNLSSRMNRPNETIIYGTLAFQKSNQISNLFGLVFDFGWNWYNNGSRSWPLSNHNSSWSRWNHIFMCFRRVLSSLCKQTQTTKDILNFNNLYKKRKRICITSV